MTEQTPIKDCPDCNSSGFYQPLMGAREPCRTCSVVSKQELAKRAVALEKTAPPGDVLVAAQRGFSTVASMRAHDAVAKRGPNDYAEDKSKEWNRRHPVVGTPPSEHQADCLCAACNNPVIETKYEVRGFRTWKITVYANGNRDEVEQEFLENVTKSFVYNGTIWNSVKFADGGHQESDTGIPAIPENLELYQMLDATCDHSAARVRWCEICTPTPCQHATERVRVWSAVGVIVRWCEVCGAVQQNEKPWEHPEK